MNISMDGIKDYLQIGSGFQFAAEQMGKLADRMVKVLKQALEYVRQDAYLAGATVVIANIVFLETAILVTRLANKILVCLFGSEEKWSKTVITVHSFFILSEISSLVIGMNIALYQGIKMPLSPLAVVAISITTCATYILFDLWKANRNQDRKIEEV